MAAPHLFGTSALTMPKEKFIRKGPAYWIINPSLTRNKKIPVIANENILETITDRVIQQASNTANAEGVESVVLNPDAHEGYGAPIGCVVVTSDTLMPGPVGFDISCSMSFLQTDLQPADVLDRRVRRTLIQEIEKRIALGAGSKPAPLQQRVTPQEFHEIIGRGPEAREILTSHDVDLSWTGNLERKWLEADPDVISKRAFERGFDQLGSLGGGNHFIEMETSEIVDSKLASHFGVGEGVVIVTHCGSRGFGHQIASEFFKQLEHDFKAADQPFPGNDRELVFCYRDTPRGERYWKSVGCGANFAIVNHLFINTALRDSLRTIFPGVNCYLVYLISHNLVQPEVIEGKTKFVHRKGATRALPSGHPLLQGTKFEATGHPALVPGSALAGSSLMVADVNSHLTHHSVNHGAGRAMGRNQARRTLDQKSVDEEMERHDVLFNYRHYPIDESAAAYKNYEDVIQSMLEARIARLVSRHKPLMVLKGND
ncbi:MAG: RtcB family protein [Acidobacteriia bacterium]|nr:RtcB family protein [Terriglobia bacterium]